MSEIFPNSEYGWQAIALAYQEQSREENIRNTDDLTRHWIKNLCTGMKRPAGCPGKKSNWILWYIAIEKNGQNAFRNAGHSREQGGGERGWGEEG